MSPSSRRGPPCGGPELSRRNRLQDVSGTLRERLRGAREFVRYCVVGGLGVLVNTGCLVALRRTGVRLEIASPVAIELSIVFNFALNAAWTFRRRAVQTRASVRFFRFHLVAAVAGLANFAVLVLLSRALGLWYVAANLVGIAIGTLVNYLLNSHWTWRRARSLQGTSASPVEEVGPPCRSGSPQ